MKIEKSKKIWSLKIPIKLDKANKDIKEYLLICKKKLGIVPNILKTNTIDVKNYSIVITYNYLSLLKKLFNKYI